MLETAMEEKPKLDRAAVRKLKLGEEDESLEYWLTQTPAARLHALENLRTPMIILHQDFRELLQLLNEKKAK
jgi:hypothetical protein